MLVARLPNYALDPATWPAVIQIDGEDEVTETTQHLLDVRTSVDVAVVTRSTVEAEVATDTTAWAAKVREVIGADPYLGGAALYTRWDGTSRPYVLADEGDPRVAVTVLSFVIERTEQALDPYST